MPMVLPSFWVGLTLGYQRQRVGLIGAILAHLVSNALTLTLALNS
jgi:hypothetical protein